MHHEWNSLMTLYKRMERFSAERVQAAMTNDWDTVDSCHNKCSGLVRTIRLLDGAGARKLDGEDLIEQQRIIRACRSHSDAVRKLAASLDTDLDAVATGKPRVLH